VLALCAGRLCELLMPHSKNSRRSLRASSAIGCVDDACQRVVAGKHAARELAHWVGGVGVGETEFRLLWLLFPASDPQSKNSHDLPDQAELAARLAVSAAQVSGAVERLHLLGLVERLVDGADRRRQMWRLSDAGRALVHSVLHIVGSAIGREAA
jgi:DNA-binding MarR family transcriptional regulator